MGECGKGWVRCVGLVKVWLGGVLRVVVEVDKRVKVGKELDEKGWFEKGV